MYIETLYARHIGSTIFIVVIYKFWNLKILIPTTKKTDYI